MNYIHKSSISTDIPLQCCVKNVINWSHSTSLRKEKKKKVTFQEHRTTEKENTAPWSPCRLPKEARQIWKPNYAPISISSSPHHILVLVRSDHSAVKHVRNPCITVLAETKRLSSECTEWTNKCLGSRMTTSPEAAGTELILDSTPYRPYLLLLRFWHWNLFFPSLVTNGMDMPPLLSSGRLGEWKNMNMSAATPHT